jgi:hypothetical protein
MTLRVSANRVYFAATTIIIVKQQQTVQEEIILVTSFSNQSTSLMQTALHI